MTNPDIPRTPSLTDYAKEVIDNLFLGTLADALRTQLLREEGITHILVVADDWNAPRSNDIAYLVLPLAHETRGRAAMWLTTARRFLNTAVTDGAVLVVGADGKSHAVLVVLDYLVHFGKHWEIEETFDLRAKLVPGRCPK